MDEPDSERWQANSQGEADEYPAGSYTERARAEKSVVKNYNKYIARTQAQYKCQTSPTEADKRQKYNPPTPYCTSTTRAVDNQKLSYCIPVVIGESLVSIDSLQITSE